MSGTNNAFSFTVLGGGIRARHAQVDAVCQEERASVRVVKLLTVVTLHCLDYDAELSLHISEKMSESGVCVRLEA